MARLLTAVCMAGIVSLVASQADAGDPFRATSDSGISSSSLSAMGLSGMRTMTQDESSQIRGQGAVAFSGASGYAVGRRANVVSLSLGLGYENRPEVAGSFSYVRSSTLRGMASARSFAFAAAK